jgi:geranylgeranyl transferase type-2 subunit beta
VVQLGWGWQAHKLDNMLPISQVKATVLGLEARVLELEAALDAKQQQIRALRFPVDAQDKAVFQDTLLYNRHAWFLQNLDVQKDTVEYVMTEHMRVQGVFWCLGAMDLLRMDDPRKAEMAEWVMTCRDAKRGGFGGNVGHDAHMLYTQHAVYVLAQCGALHLLDRDGARQGVVAYIQGLQKPDGSFAGDEWGEIDTRFTYCAAVTLAVLGSLDAVDGLRACQYVVSTRNELDGGFGCAGGVESHAGYVFTALGALSVFGKLDLVENWDGLAWWLAERQCDSGGLNGRPEKLADVCYSWWVLSSLAILGRLDWIDKDKLVRFILRCQDPEQGGIADHPDNCGDVYHTFFGLCGLSLLCYLQAPEYGVVDPVFALPRRVVQELGLMSAMLK